MSIDFFMFIAYGKNMEEEKETHEHSHPWKVRLFVALVMLVLAFVGLIVSDLRQRGAWNYWRIMVPVYAVLSLFLSWYLRSKKRVVNATTIWHELVQWAALALSVYLISIFVNVGLLGRFEAGLVVLTLLALTIFIAGIYIDPPFYVIGLLLGFFAAAAAVLAAYIYTVMLPVTLVVAVILIWIARRKSKPKS